MLHCPFCDLPHTARHTHTHERHSFSVPAHFQMSLNTTSEPSQHRTTDICQWLDYEIKLCFMCATLPLMGSVFYMEKRIGNRESRKGNYEAGKGTLEGKLKVLICHSSMCRLRTTLWPKQRWCIPCRACNWPSDIELNSCSIFFLMTFSKLSLTLWGPA